MNMRNWKWRVANLYSIKNKNGQKIPFRPNWAQQYVIDNLWFFSVILKARKLGFTTLFCILYLDQVLFSANKTAGIIAHTDKDVKDLFNDIVKFAWDNLPDWLKKQLGPPNTDSTRELSFPNGSRIFVTMSTRSGTPQFLHISEFGKICARFPAKAREIITGSINAVAQGNFVTIESTAEGNTGSFAEICKEAEQAMKSRKKLSPLEFKFFFFPWWQEPTYRSSTPVVISAELATYFKELKAKHGINLDEEQKYWYAAKRNLNKDDMFREFPSVPEEAFRAAVEGAYYAREMLKVYEDRRIRPVPWDSRLPVTTWWDLGMNDTNVILFTQGVGNEIRLIDCYSNTGEGLAHYVNHIKSKPYVYERHVLPHDADVRNLDEQGLSRRQTLANLGLYNIHVVERTKSVLQDIEKVRQLFSRFYFDEEKCAELIKACNEYRKEWDDKLGQFKNSPLHNKASHLVDPLRLIASAWNQHQIATPTGRQSDRYEDFF